MNMSRYCNVGVAILSLLAIAACGRPKPSSTTPRDVFAAVPVAPLPTASLGGVQVLLLTVGTVQVGDTVNRLPALEARRSALVGTAYAALDSALRRDAREVEWMGLEEQLRAAGRNPTLGVRPERFATVYLSDPELEVIPDPLWGQARTLIAVMGGRFVLVPAAVRLRATGDAVTATYLLVMADARSGRVLWRGRLEGRPAPTAEAAFAAAAATAIATPLP
jgi:hypothetical protein